MNSSNTDACKYRNIRDLVTHVVRNKSNSSDDDPSGIDKILISELKVELQARVLLIVSLKPDLILRLKEAIDSEM